MVIHIDVPGMHHPQLNRLTEIVEYIVHQYGTQTGLSTGQVSCVVGWLERRNCSWGSIGGSVR